MRSTVSTVMLALVVQALASAPGWAGSGCLAGGEAPVYPLRILIAGVPHRNVTLKWQGVRECVIDGAELERLHDDGYYWLPLSPSEIPAPGETLSASIELVVAPGGAPDTMLQSQALDVDVTGPAPSIPNRLDVTFVKDEITRDVIPVLQRLRYNEKKIFETFLRAKYILSQASDYNIRVVAAFLYFDSARAIENAPKNFKSGISISRPARDELKAILAKAEDVQDPEHDGYAAAIKRYSHILGRIEALKSQLGD